MKYNGNNMKVKIPKQVKHLLKTFEKEGFEIYIAGGAIRDILLGKTVYDWDFATSATPQAMLKFLPDAYYTNEFGTVGIPPEVEGKRPLEITTYRTEHGYSDSRRPDHIEWGKTLEEDLQRRDFTINAMALKPVISDQLSAISKKTKKAEIRKSKSTEFELIDLYQGQKDLKNKLIRAVGNPNERFGEDALRMMRAIRIGAELNFKIEEETLNAIKKSSPLINKIAKERVGHELIKTLASVNPYHGMVLFKESGLMQQILPEMEKTFGVEQKSPGRHHIYDVGTHSMLSLKYVAEKNSDPIVRLATMIHDIGKPTTFKKQNGLITFYNHEMASANITKRVAGRLKFSKKQTERLYRLVRWHQFSVDERQTDSALRRFLKNVGLDNVLDMLDLRVGDRLGGGARETSWRLEEFKARLIEVQKQPFTVHDLKITGHEVMKKLGIKPGPKVGEILEKLYEEIVEKKVPNEKKELMERLKEIT